MSLKQKLEIGYFQEKLISMSSMLATKYQRYGYVHMEPFLPGKVKKNTKIAYPDLDIYD